MAVENERVKGDKLITATGETKVCITRQGPVSIGIWAGTGDADSVATWAGRTVKVQSSHNGSNWCDVARLDAIGVDTIDQSLLIGGLYYRVVLVTGADMVGIHATIIHRGSRGSA